MSEILDIAIKQFNSATSEVPYYYDTIKNIAAGTQRDDNKIIQRGRELYTSYIFKVAEISITNITYGNRAITDPDIHTRIREDLQHGRDGFLVHNDNLGGDPQPGQPKTLVVEYRDHPSLSPIRVSAKEGHVLPTSYRIHSAHYGGVNVLEHMDVAARLQDALNHGVSLTVGNAVMGRDPTPGRAKELHVCFIHAVEHSYYVSEWDWRVVEVAEGKGFPQAGFDVKELFARENELGLRFLPRLA